MLAFAAACEDDDKDKDKTPTDGGGSPAAGITPATGPKALTIGGLFSFTGRSPVRAPIENGAKLGVADCNAAGGIGGGTVEMKSADDGTDGTVGVDAANQLVDLEGAEVILGPLASGVTASVAEAVSVPKGMLLISPSATAPT